MNIENLSLLPNWANAWRQIDTIRRTDKWLKSIGKSFGSRDLKMEGIVNTVMGVTEGTALSLLVIASIANPAILLIPLGYEIVSNIKNLRS